MHVLYLFLVFTFKIFAIAFIAAIPRYYYTKSSAFGLTPQCYGSETSLFQCVQVQCHRGRYSSAGVQCPG